MSVPSETPTAAKRRYCGWGYGGWSAVAKPSARRARTSIAAYGTLGQDLAEQPGRQPDAEELREADEHDDRQDHRHGNVTDGPAAAEDRRRHRPGSGRGGCTRA